MDKWFRQVYRIHSDKMPLTNERTTKIEIIITIIKHRIKIKIIHSD